MSLADAISQACASWTSSGPSKTARPAIPSAWTSPRRPTSTRALGLPRWVCNVYALSVFLTVRPFRYFAPLPTLSSARARVAPTNTTRASSSSPSDARLCSGSNSNTVSASLPLHPWIVPKIGPPSPKSGRRKSAGGTPAHSRDRSICIDTDLSPSPAMRISSRHAPSQEISVRSLCSIRSAHLFSN
jgi:hypothetical protein